MIQFVALHKTAGSFRRVDIVKYVHQKGECTVNEVAEYERFSQPSASYHLLKLQREGFLSSRREGRNTYYRLTKRFHRSKLLQGMLKRK